MKAFVAQCGVRELLVAAEDAHAAARVIAAAGGPPADELTEAGALAETFDEALKSQAIVAPHSLFARPVWARRRRYDRLAPDERLDAPPGARGAPAAGSTSGQDAEQPPAPVVTSSESP
jgi:hypothetical protein